MRPASCNTGTSMCEIGGCATGFDDCDADPLNGCEVDTRTDANFCGDCGTHCSPGDRCVGSSCEGSPFVQISAGASHTLMRRSAGGMVGWGSGAFGRLGDGAATNRATPSPSPWTFQTIDAGVEHGCGVTFGGQVVCWGQARYRLLDTTDGVDQPGGVLIDGVSDAIDVCAGTFHSCAVNGAGQVLCWGDDTFGALGTGATNVGENGPAVVAGLDNVVAVECGFQFSCALRETAPGAREVWCWGRGDNGQRGDGDTATGTGIPRRALFPAGVTDLEQLEIGANGWSVAVRTVSQEVYTWGRNDNGVLGLGSASPVSIPANVGINGVLDVGISFVTACAVRQVGADRLIQCWGRNSDRQLGSTFTGSQRFEPSEPVEGVTHATEVAVGDTHACAITRDDSSGAQTMYCWGERFDGRTGNGEFTTADVHPPVVVQGL
ncbi:MAG: RCC1 domain-containing protein [Sandaracinaceae bacterium]